MPLPIALDYRPALLSSAGIGRATRELAAALALRDDVVVHLFGHALAAARRPVAAPARARLHRLPIPGRTLPWLHRLGLGADRLAGGATVFHWTDYVQPPVSRARPVLTVHDLAFVRDPSWHGANAAVLRERTAAALARAAAVVVPSAATAADVRAFAPHAPTPRVIPFGADHVPTPAPAGAHPFAGRRYALCTGTIEPRKDHMTLLAAWRTLPAPRPLLVVVGRPGWQCREITAALRAAAQEGLVDWRDAAGDGELFALLRHADLLVYPSRWEGFGFPPLEAMQLSVPVVAADTAPMRELGDGALALCPPGDAAALADAIARVFADAAHAARLRAAGRRRAAAFRWRDCAAAHAALYREVAP
ncbi:MAG: glycosyltransferase family 4 protein [Planctomycetes bacterium]|nr:glycosyltransferase family 4 protein [Planctomycetota bacterium]